MTENKVRLQTDFGEYDAADYKISDLTDKKFVIYPFISIQKAFGYSDVTAKNNQEERVRKTYYYEEYGEFCISKFMKYGKGLGRDASAKIGKPDELCFSESAIFVKCKDL